MCRGNGGLLDLCPESTHQQHPGSEPTSKNRVFLLPPSFQKSVLTWFRMISNEQQFPNMFFPKKKDAINKKISGFWNHFLMMDSKYDFYWDSMSI